MAVRDSKPKDDIEDVEEAEETKAPVVETEEEEKQFWSDDKKGDAPDPEKEVGLEDEEKETPEPTAPEDEENPEVPEEQVPDQDSSDESDDDNAETDLPEPSSVSHSNSDFPPTELHGITGTSDGGSNKLKIGAAVVAVLAMMGAGFWFYQSNMNQQDSAQVAGESTVMSEPTLAPQPEVAEVNFADYTVQILNGSGTPGEAAKVQELLAPVGFEEFITGNAKSYSYKETEIAVVIGTPDEVLDKIKEVLGENYAVTVSPELDETSDYDVVIIVGSKEAE